MADDKKKDEAAEPSGPKMIMGFPLPIFGFLAMNVVVMLGGAFFIAQTALMYKKPPITEKQAAAEITKKIEKQAEVSDGFYTENYPEMTINLKGASGGKPHFVLVEVSVACGSQNCLSQVQDNRAKIIDAIQMVLSQRTYTELSTLEVKFRIKHEIISMINGWLKGASVVDVLFTQFIVQ